MYLDMCLLLFSKYQSEAEIFVCKARDINLMTTVKLQGYLVIVLNDYNRFNQLCSIPVQKEAVFHSLFCLLDCVMLRSSRRGEGRWGQQGST